MTKSIPCILFPFLLVRLYCLSNEDRVDKDTITTKNIYDEYIMYCKFAKGKLYDKDKEKE